MLGIGDPVADFPARSGIVPPTAYRISHLLVAAPFVLGVNESAKRKHVIRLADIAPAKRACNAAHAGLFETGIRDQIACALSFRIVLGVSDLIGANDMKASFPIRCRNLIA